MCKMCGGPVMVLGTMGEQVVCRCRNCGLDQYLNADLFEVEDDEDEIETA